MEEINREADFSMNIRLDGKSILKLIAGRFFFR
jgi:hypothetical protein